MGSHTCDLNDQYKNNDVGHTSVWLTRYTDDENTCEDGDECASDVSPWEVTSVQMIQVSKAPIILAMIWIGDKTNHVTQMILAKTLSDHLNVLV